MKGRDISKQTRHTKKLSKLLSERYDLIERIGTGGMGSVFTAFDREREELVALKTLQFASKYDCTHKVRFEREFSLCSEISSPLVVKHYDMGKLADGTHYLTMEYLEHGSIQNLMSSKKRIEEPVVAEIARGLAEALVIIHDKGIFHRDIKPANILFRPDGKPALADFGLALDPELTALTETGYVLGTPMYMPVEAFEGITDGRSDIYSLGAVIYEMLTGQPPFFDTSIACLLTKIRYSSHIPISQVRPDLSPKWDRVIGKCLAKDTNVRYQNAALLLDDLNRSFPIVENSEKASHQKARPKKEPNKGKKANPTKDAVEADRRHPHFVSIVFMLFLIVSAFYLTTVSDSSNVLSDSTVFIKAEDWFLHKNGFVLRFDTRHANGPSWRLTTSSNKTITGQFERVRGCWCLSNKELKLGEQYQLEILDGDTVLGNKRFSVPKTQLVGSFKAAIGLDKLAFSWKLYGHGTVKLKVSSAPDVMVERYTRKTEMMVPVPPLKNRARTVEYRIEASGIELAHGKSVLGLNERTKLERKFLQEVEPRIVGDGIVTHLLGRIVALSHVASPNGNKLILRTTIDLKDKRRGAFAVNERRKELLIVHPSHNRTMRFIRARAFDSLWDRQLALRFEDLDEIDLGFKLAKNTIAIHDIEANDELAMFASEARDGSIVLFGYQWSELKTIKPLLINGHKLLGVARLSNQHVIVCQKEDRLSAHHVEVDDGKLVSTWKTDLGPTQESHISGRLSFAICSDEKTNEVLIVSGPRAFTLTLTDSDRKVRVSKHTLPIKEKAAVSSAFSMGKTGYVIGTTTKLASYMSVGFRVSLVTIDTRTSHYRIKSTELSPSVVYKASKIGNWGMAFHNYWIYIDVGNHFMKVSNSMSPKLEIDFPHYFSSRSKPFIIGNTLYVRNNHSSIYAVELIN